MMDGRKLEDGFVVNTLRYGGREGRPWPLAQNKNTQAFGIKVPKNTKNTKSYANVVGPVEPESLAASITCPSIAKKNFILFFPPFICTHRKRHIL